MTSEQIAYRIRMLPEQLDRARRRVAHLEAEARRMGMTELLEKETAHGRTDH